MVIIRCRLLEGKDKVAFFMLLTVNGRQTTVNGQQSTVDVRRTGYARYTGPRCYSGIFFGRTTDRTHEPYVPTILPQITQIFTNIIDSCNL